FQNFSRACRSYSNESLKNPRAHVEKSGSKRVRGRNKSTVFENHSRFSPAHSGCHSFERSSSPCTAGRSSSIGSFCRYCVLHPSRFRRSHTAFVRLTPSSENRETISEVRRNSASPTDHPSRARKFRNASGRK